ncbi:alpha/beta hydrolase [uncultured Paenibacillus sp.]|uniref:alpha/beta hydrolase n=1 Tax=uncultured Paenibacillus sp. TaxID=227322 RepID=UPI0015AA5418|nr:alpha/beta hydrolase [uncultured Paenibacillus sp.]
MEEHTFTFGNDTSHDVFVYRWSAADPEASPRGVLQIAHGMAETAKRYERLARVLTARGFIVYANDHRGHGRTAGGPEELGWPGKQGFTGMAEDMIRLSAIIRREHPNLPLFLLGHSMGSFLTQKVMYRAPEPYDGFILSGTNGPRSLLGLGRSLARLQARLQGDGHPSLLMNALTFGSFNRNFLPARTPFDWLSRDDEEVDKYIADPHCGFLCSAGFFYGFFGLLQEIHRPENMRSIPKEKPVYIFGGDLDPVGRNGAGVRRLVELYGRLGLEDVEVKLYPGGRHEMLNEINRDEVTSDVLYWLESHMPSEAAAAEQ